MTHLSGIHHVTAISGDALRNVEFYSHVLGLRLVKRTVNFDDPRSYHLYYGDLSGTPGTILTFFAWPGAAPAQLGAGEPSAVAFSVPTGSLSWWKTRLTQAGIAAQDPTERFGEPVLSFRDPDGMKVELVETARRQAHEVRFWALGPVPVEFAIRGIHSATVMHVSGHTNALGFQADLGFSPLGASAGRQRFGVGGTEVSSFIDVVSGETRRGRMGAGTIHHLAFRTTDAATQLAWQQKLLKADYHVTDVKDRTYFESIYFRERGGVLFEIATDGPGFTLDESEETLGEALKLPRQYEPMRKSLEASLPPLTLTGNRI